MSNSVSKIAIHVTGNTKPLQAEMNQAVKSVGQLNAVGNGVGKVGTMAQQAVFAVAAGARKPMHRDGKNART